MRFNRLKYLDSEVYELNIKIANNIGFVSNKAWLK